MTYIMLKAPLNSNQLTNRLFQNYSQTEVKEKLRNLTINRKNYQNACRHSYCYYGNGERWRRIKYTTDFDA